MRVQIHPDVFRMSDPQRSVIRAVARLLETFEDGRHDWAIHPYHVDDFAAFLPLHFPSLARTYTSMARLAAKREAAWTGTDQVATSIIADADGLEDLAADLSRAAVVVVEDLRTDGTYFLETLIEVFGPERLRTAYREHWLEVHHSGGKGRMPAVAAAAARRFRRLIRVIAFLDSDRLTPDDPGNADSVSALEANRIHAHMLTWREAENYAPDRVLSRCGKRHTAEGKVELLNHLLPHQRGVYDMKKGFARGIPQQQEVFAALDSKVVEGLRPGFGDIVLQHMYELRFELTAADFEAVDSAAADDLRTLLRAIERLV
jgi:hypothetical protein